MVPEYQENEPGEVPSEHLNLGPHVLQQQAPQQPASQVQASEAENGHVEVNPTQQETPPTPQPDPSQPPSGSVHPAQNVSPPAVPDPLFNQDAMATNMLGVNYIKKMRPFYGNKPPRDEKQRAWEEYLSEFVQNAETCRLPQDQYQYIAELMLAPKVRDHWMQAKASMNCNSWEVFNNYMSTHYAALDKLVEAERKFSNNVLTHET